MFALMLVYSCGYEWGRMLYGSTLPGEDVYLQAQTIAGWVQWGCLAAWGLHDGGKALFDRFGLSRSLPFTYDRA
jgi:hypothetical protein